MSVASLEQAASRGREEIMFGTGLCEIVFKMSFNLMIQHQIFKPSIYRERLSSISRKIAWRIFEAK